MPNFSELEAQFAMFDGLPVSEQTSDQRKAMVRSLENGVRGGDVALTDNQFRQCRYGAAPLGRILAYLYVEYDKINSRPQDRRMDVEGEWERLQRTGFRAGTSTMPLYYAVRSYLNGLKAAPGSVASGQADRGLFGQIADSLKKHGLDSGGQVRGAIDQIVLILDRNTSPDPANEAARIASKASDVASRRQMIVAVLGGVLAAGVALLVAILENWEKEPIQKLRRLVGATARNEQATRWR